MPNARPEHDADRLPPISIKRVGAKCWKSLRAIRLKSLELDPLAFGSTLARELAYTDSLWIERTMKYSTSATDAVWVASCSGALVGTAGIFSHEGSFHMFGVWVEPAFRGRHIGSMLLDAAIDWMRSSHPSSDLLLGVNPSQASAVTLYLSRGFAFTGSEEPLSHTPGQVVKEMRLDARTSSKGSCAGAAGNDQTV